MTHAWCSDPSRDAAVRAAEDGRDRPLPTLDECIEAVRERRSDHTTGEEMSQGLRTERVTLEITGAPGWKVHVTGSDVESVRVVEDEEGKVSVGDNEPWQKAILNDAVSIIVDGGDWGRGNSMDHGKLGAAVIWADKEIGRLRARVAVMEEARKRFDTALEEARDASGINDLIVQRDEAFDERDAAIRERDAHKEEYYKLRAESGGVSSLPSISGDGKSNVKESQAAVAWGCDGPDGRLVHVSTFMPQRDPATIVPLYRSPPQPRGWLTGEERDLIAGITDDDEYTEDGQNIAKALLARSSPPEVVLPENPYHPSGLREGFEHALRSVRNELVNAGVEVKDAPK